SSSLTLSLPLSKLRTRIDTLRLAKKGLFQRRPLSLTVPTYLPNRLSTADLLGSTLYRPATANTAAAASTTLAMTRSIGDPVGPNVPTALKNSQAAATAAATVPSRTGMPGKERIGFSFMAGLSCPQWTMNGYQIDITIASGVPPYPVPVRPVPPQFLVGAAEGESFWTRRPNQARGPGTGDQ